MSTPHLDKYAPFVKAERCWFGQDQHRAVVVKWGDYDQSPWPGGPQVVLTGGPPPFLVREHLAGPSLQEMAPLLPDAALELFAHVLSALDRMHRRGIVHGRLKPSNIFTAGLTDPGLLVAETDPSAVLFRAPELSGARSATVGPSADLYSAGACLGFMLTGQPPYQARDLSEAVRAPFSQALPTLGSVPGLDAMMTRLMSVDPEERYTSAAEALADLSRLRETPESFVPGAHELRDKLAAPALVGRGELLEAVSRQLDQGGLLQLVGEAGSGKSRLAEQARRMARAKGHLVLRGRARQRMADAPLQILDELCQELLSQSDQGELTRVLADLGPWRPVVGTALPALGGSGQHGPDAHAWTRTRQALSVFLQVLGTAQRPALVILEDLHWSPPDILELLAQQRPSSHVAILITSRRELVLQGGQCQRVENLASRELERLACSMLGRCQTSALAMVTQASEGNPYRLVSLLKRWVRQGVLQPGAEGWSASEEAGRTGWSPPPASEVDASSEEILGLAAVVGREIQPAFLGQIFEPTRVREALLCGCSAGLVQSLGQEEWAFTHDLAREAVLSWRPADRTARHLRVALALCRMPTPPAQEIAYHFHHAGKDAEALPFARRAAAAARRRHALSAAETYLRIALAGAGEEASLWEELGDVQRIAGRYEAAHESYSRSLALTYDRLARARILGGRGEAAFGDGRLEAAKGFFSEALVLLGHVLPARRWQKNLALLSELMTFLLPRSGQGELDAAQRLAMYLLDRLAYVLAYSDGYGLVWANLRGLNLARSAAPGREMGTALMTHAVATLYVPPLVFRCRGLAKRALELLEQNGGRDYERAAATARAATIDLFTDNPAETVRLDEWAVPILQRSGDRYDAHMSTYNLGLACYFTGQLERAREILRENLRQCLSVGDSLGGGFTMRVLGLLDPLSEDLLSRLPTNPAFPSAQILLDESRGLYHLQRGEFPAAIAHLEHGNQLARGSGDIFEDFWTGLFLLRARRLQALREHGSHRLALEQRAARDGGRYLSLAEKGYKVFLPRACRELALLKLHHGGLDEAESLLKRGLRAARDCGMRYEEALALWELAELGRLSGVSTEGERSEATRLFRLTGSTWERSSSPSARHLGVAVVERFDQVVSWTQTIASQASAHEVIEAARQAAESLLRCRAVRLSRARTQSEVTTLVPRESSTLSALAIPLPWADDPGTELYCFSEEAEDHFGAEELRLASLIQGQARVALSNARLWADLREREAHLEQLFSSVPAGIAVVDVGGIVRQANPRLEAMLDRSPLEQPLVGLFQSDDGIWLQSALRELRSGRMLQRELRVDLPDGRWLWGELSVQRLPGAEERAIVVLADVSQRRLEQIAVFQDRERHMLASEVHDVLSQPVVALQLHLEALAHKNPQVGAALKESAQTARDVLADMRGLIARLRSPHIERLGLSQAIEDAVEELVESASCQVGVELDPGVDSLPPLPTLFIYRMVAEALTNCGRHAHAKRVRLRLRVQGSKLRGIIADDGAGFSESQVASGRFGLRIVRERAELLGGRAWIRSAPGRGTAVLFHLPLARS